MILSLSCLVTLQNKNFPTGSHSHLSNLGLANHFFCISSSVPAYSLFLLKTYPFDHPSCVPIQGNRFLAGAVVLFKSVILRFSSLRCRRF